MADPIHVLRTSHDHFAALVGDLDAEQVTAPSYASEWSIADTASHLGSQAEIFDAFVGAGLAGEEPPANDAFPPIWDRWNAMSPAEQVSTSVSANEAFVARVEGLSPEQRSAFAVEVFGMPLDLAGMAGMRLGEHALHTWDVAVALDPGAVVPADAVEVLVGVLPVLIGRVVKAVDGAGTVRVVTSDPTSEHVVDLAAGALGEGPASRTVTLPAEAFVRLVFGRLDADHTPSGIDDPDGALDDLRRAFPGF